ncbi:hypothetical protein EMPS_11209 [Entomortierella parvispora]|uniref:Uncharacterized protein n=1 Tax=Entomortierella parvispora TaxID=205924 RepID=A0A9P3M2A8_9FUNG|nr:hypothetical protein EMPS_11209 [Entomortierella parvispora]
MTFNLKGSTPQISFRKASVRILGVPGITTLPIVRTKFDLSIWDGAAVTSSFVSDWTSVSTKGFELEMDIEPTTLIVDPENLQALISLLSTLRSTASHTITLRGHASVDLALSVPLAALGVPIHLDLKTIPVLGAAVSTDMNLQGLNNFGGVARGLLDSVSAIEKVGASAGLVRFKIVLHNPASVTIQLGKIKFQVWTSSAKTDLLGIATYEEFNAVPGENIADTVLEADSAAKLGEFFPVKTGFSLTFTGYDGSSDHPIAVGVMSSIEFIVEF